MSHFDVTSTVLDVRETFLQMLFEERRSPGRHSVAGTLEIIGASFVADQPAIFGSPNQDYIRREIEWYMSGSLNVYEIEAPVPKIWTAICSKDGQVNSNYGFLMFSKINGAQFANVLRELRDHPEGRRATAIYTRPSMHTDWQRDGMSDFVCTNAVCYFVRHGAVHAVVQMRSNDVVFGYRNDYAWQRWILEQLATLLGVQIGSIIWHAASLHLYERHWALAEND